MTILHHPADELLSGYAAGTLDQGMHVAVATHLQLCTRCRDWVHGMEQLGGAAIGGLPPAEMADDALARLEARLVEAAPPVSAAPRASSACAMPQLPPFVRALPAGKWKWLAPGLHLRRLALTAPGATRVFLLRAKAGLRLLPHDHTGIEMTCVLTGSFGHDGASFCPGDFDFGDRHGSHEIVIGPQSECICLVAMQGKLKLKGWLGRAMQPFVSL